MALLRLSLTADPSDRGFVLGLAIKWLIETLQRIFSALVSLMGQGNNYNFFANEFSNIVPVVNQIGPKLINLIFMRVSKHPTKLNVTGWVKSINKVEALITLTTQLSYFSS